MFEMFTNTWKNIEALKNWNSILFWLSISLVLFGALLQIARYIVETRVKTLRESLQIEKESDHKINENILKDKLSILEKDITKKNSEIDELKEKAKFTNPYEQPLVSGSANIEVIISGIERGEGHNMGAPVFLGFVKGNQGLLVMRADDCNTFHKENTTIFKANVRLSEEYNLIGKPVLNIKEAEYIQIGFRILPENSKIIKGIVNIILNEAVRFEFTIPAQIAQKDIIFVRDLSKAFAKIK